MLPVGRSTSRSSKVDSDKAFEVGQKHGGDKVLTDAPDTPVSYLLDWSVSTNNLVWHVIYGNSRNDAKLVVDLDASTGEFIGKRSEAILHHRVTEETTSSYMCSCSPPGLFSRNSAGFSVALCSLW